MYSTIKRLEEKHKEKSLIKTNYLSIEDFEYLKNLLKFESVSGKEEKVSRFIEKELIRLGFNVNKDTKGNLFAVRGMAEYYPMLNAHMDIVNLNKRFSSSFNRNTFSSTSVSDTWGKQEKEEKKSTKYDALWIDNYSYDYDSVLQKDVEEVKAKKCKEKAKNAISDGLAKDIWDKNEKERSLLYGHDYKVIGFKCANCVNSCKSFKLCYFFEPNNSIETKRQYAYYKLSSEKAEVEEYNPGYIQQSFDIDNNIRKIKNVSSSANLEKSTKTKKSSKTKMDEEKYIITVDLIKDKIYGKGKKRVLGGDDKCGIFIALKVAELLPNMPMKILFTTEEETGCNGVKHFVRTNKEWLNDVKYSITIDRRGAADLLWSQRGTRSCDNDFAGEVMNQGIRSGIPVVLADGGSADVVVLRDHVPNAINMSAGYYNAHKVDEYIVPSEVDKIVGWVKNIIQNI